MEKKQLKRLSIIFLAAAFAVTIGFAVQGHVQAARYRRLLDNSYRYAFAELTTAAGELDVSLQKAAYATSPALFSVLCAQTYAKAMAAQSALGELPYGNVELEQTASFLAKTGDYALALAGAVESSQVCTQEHRDTLQSLSQSAAQISEILQSIQEDLTAGTLEPESLDQVQERLTAAGQEGEQVEGGSAFQTVEADFPEVPSLIYDGPFSEHLSNRSPRMLEGLPQVDEQTAKEAAASFFNLRSDIFTLTSSGEGALPTYGFTAMVDGGQLYIEVTKQGGQILQLLSSRPVGEQTITRREGYDCAVEFLTSRGFQDMYPSYAIDQNGLLTIHFASRQDNVYCYPDLVKVQVALDTGDIVGFEAHGYLMNHGVRELSSPTVSAQQAANQVPDSLAVLGTQLAVIPTDGEYEVLCYEFKCQSASGSHVLIYVNAQTGEQERILLLLEDESGTLVI